MKTSVEMPVTRRTLLSACLWTTMHPTNGVYYLVLTAAQFHWSIIPTVTTMRDPAKVGLITSSGIEGYINNL